MLKGAAILTMIITVLIGAVVLGAVIEDIADNTAGVTGGNVSTTTANILDLIPVLVGIGFLLGILSAVGLKVTGKI